MDKPFKSIDEQIAILQSRGVQTDKDTYNILLREGYYSIVNGYKAPFIDKIATAENGEDVYDEGTRFSDIYSLFLFDRDLREMTFHHVIRAEALVRTICSYTFSEAHPEPNAYLEKDNFATAAEYEEFGLVDFESNYDTLHKTLKGKRKYSKREFVEHYRSTRQYPYLGACQ